MAGEFADEHVRRAARTYSAAADHYLLPALGFWDRFGAATVDRLSLPRGATVLDLCCGAGASALAAARVVGGTGRVLGIDVAEPLLAAARRRAAVEGLANVSFRAADARATGLESGSFDAVVCVFGVFFAADMESFLAEMWRLVAPGGTLAVTTWGEGFLEPAATVFWTAVGELDPSLFRAFNPWDEITSPEALEALMRRSGISPTVVEAVAAEHRLAHPRDFWDMALGSGYRATIDALPATQREHLRTRVLDELTERRVTALRTHVVFGTAVSPADRG